MVSTRVFVKQNINRRAFVNFTVSTFEEEEISKYDKLKGNNAFYVVQGYAPLAQMLWALPVVCNARVCIN